MAATTTLLGLVTPTQGTLSGTWGDTVNYGISDYVDIAIAGTLSFAGDGAITLANTTGSSSGNGIGATTAQYMVIRITGTQTVTKVITGPSYSKLYMVDHAGATSAVTFKAAGQTGVSIAVGEKAFVYYNGTDYVKVSTSVISTGTVTSVGGTGTVNGISLSGTVTTSGSLTLGGTLSLVSPPAIGSTTPNTGAFTTLSASGATTLSAQLIASTGDGSYPMVSRDTSAFSAGVSGSKIGFFGLDSTSTNTALGAISTLAQTSQNATLRAQVLNSGSLTTIGTFSTTGLAVTGAISDSAGALRAVPQSGSAKTTSYTLAVGDVGEFIELGASGAIVIPNSTFAAGDVVSIFNNTASTATITCSITTAYIAGTFTDKATMTLAAAGVATVLFITSTLCVVSGNVT